MVQPLLSFSLPRIFSRLYLYYLFPLLLACTTIAYGQPGASPPLGAGPWVFDTYAEKNVKVSVLTKGLDHPFGMVFLPDTATTQYPVGDVLISERTGKIRLFRNDQLIEKAIVDLVNLFSMEQLFDLKLHPQFEQNGLIYFSYIKTAPHPSGSDAYWVTTALGRGRFDGNNFVDLEDVFVAEAWSSNFGGASSRLQFMPDGTILLGVSHRIDREAPQSLSSHIGKVLRLNDDGSAPADNPFVAIEGALPEIYTLGNRSVMDFVTHPVTGEVWNLENGPQGGDEVNILKPGFNYGWPIATFGRDYDGSLFNPKPWVEGTELPEVFWVPSITVAGMDFYTGDKFPDWKGSLFVSSMVTGRVFGTGHLERVVFNEFGEIMREQLLNELHQRIRYVSQGPEELIYLLTDADDGALLMMEPSDLPEPAANDDDIMFSTLDCRACHQAEDTLVGPSYQAIAERYSLNEANIALLAEKIIKGGGGSWGEIPMAPHTNLDAETASAMATQILSLTDQ